MPALAAGWQIVKSLAQQQLSADRRLKAEDILEGRVSVSGAIEIVDELGKLNRTVSFREAR
ncbi:MAG: hypothetical protein WKF52_11195 [Sphingomicrobium sp.]